MGKRLVSLLTALALAVSAFAGLTVAPAGAQTGPEWADTSIFFPFVPNGEELAGTGPWFGTITVQNLEIDQVIIEAYPAGSNTRTAWARVNENGSRTFTASDIFGTAGATTFYPVRGAPADGADTIRTGACSPVSISVRQGSTAFSSPADYTWSFSGGVLTINWAPGGNEPAPGSSYQVTASGPGCGAGGGVWVRACVDDGNNACGDRSDEDAVIAGLMKSAAPVALSSDARTSGRTEMVTGYSALPLEAIEAGTSLEEGVQWALPIVQSGWSGWNSVIYITNFDEVNNCAVDVTLYQSPFGLGDPAPGIFSETLNPGETWILDLTGWRQNWAGSAFIDADCQIGVSSDRIKAEQPWGDPVNMAISNVGQPFEEAAQDVYAPLVFDRYNGWNTGFAVVNLASDRDANVTIQFFNLAGAPAGSATMRLRPRAVEWVYRPSLSNLGLRAHAQAIITADEPIAVAVDSVKYVGQDQDTGHALSYNAQEGGTDLALPLFQNAGSSNDMSGVAIFNPQDTITTVTVEVYNRVGNRYASIEYSINPRGAAILYPTIDLPELPGGFTGSIVITADDDVVAVSNNVAYRDEPNAGAGPSYDGAAAFNLAFVD